MGLTLNHYQLVQCSAHLVYIAEADLQILLINVSTCLIYEYSMIFG